jgi:opacity protein-like surface antigen
VNAKVETNLNESDFAGDTQDQLTSLPGFWGTNAGFGTEYPVSEHVSVGGEYGIRSLRTSAEGKGSADSILPGDGVSDEITASLKSSMVRVVLNYSF